MGTSEKNLFETKFIPHIETMIEKEENHLSSLELTKEKLFDEELCLSFSSFNKGIKEEILLEKTTLKRMISRSKTHLAFYKKRLEEYKDFAKNL